jgi:hypothetical protein
MNNKFVSLTKTGAGCVRSAIRRGALMTLVVGALAAATTAQAKTVRADFNGDGYDDLAIGVPNETIAGDISAGAVHVIYGSATGLTALGSQLWFQDLSGIVREFSEPFDAFGAALAVGDFNGDGYADLAIGAPGEDLGLNNSIDSAGVVHILYGSPSGLSDANDQIWDQDSPGTVGVPAASAFFGSALAAGDFDNDGFTDLAIGIRGQNIGGAPGAGAVQVLRGSATGLTGTGSEFFTDDLLLFVGQSEPFDNFGAALAAADFNGDGFADLAIGEPGEDNFVINGSSLTDNGQVFVVFGSSTGLNSQPMQELVQGVFGIQGSAESNDRFGSVLAAGDFNGDGHADLVVGVPEEDIGTLSNAGAVNVIYGDDSGLNTVANQLWFQNVTGIADASETSDSFGRALAIGDFNGDGYDDLAIGVPFEDLPGIVAGDTDASAGAVNVIYGSSQGLTATNNQLWDQNTSNIEDVREDFDNFGASLAAGDFNGDGHDDLAVGVPFEDVGSIANAGAVNVIYGTTRTGLSAGGIFPGEHVDQFWHQDVSGIAGVAESNDRFGSTLASLGLAASGGAGLSGAWKELRQTCGEACRLHGQFDVSNPAIAAAGESILRFYLSRDEILDDADTLLNEVLVPAVDPGETIKIKVNLALDPEHNAQGYFLIAVVDATDVVAEVNEKNNIIVSTVIQ